MDLAEFIETNKDRLVEQWRKDVVERLSLDLDRSELLNHLPAFLDELVSGLRSGTGEWPPMESAKQHGGQRMQVGVDVGSLTQEMNLVGVAVAEVARQQGEDFSTEEILGMMMMIGRGAAASVSAYAKLRDEQVADQAAQHFSFIAHEIRNPLHSARLAAEVLALSPEGEREEHVKRLERALRQLADLVDDSLIEARLYGEPRLRIERLRSLELVQQAHEDLGGQIADKNLVVAHEVEDFVLDADPTLLGSALINVMRNAVKFTRERGHILVVARHTNGDAVFEVHDECGGIPEDFLPRLFQPFVQARSEKGGSGLGLLIVKQAVEAHGGTVSVDNHPGKGCCFRLALPRKKRTDNLSEPL